ncbi:LysR family transcriptional regulator [Endozoicomonas sp. OPT23]|nr:LysR family transcriptional regulator [Endozoicomonas sp. OPT23]
MNLTIRQLEAFREVFKSSSISEAARVLNRTQPAVSSMISNLEEELGLALFERKKGRLLHTPEANHFFEETAALLERLERVTHTMKDLAGLQDGQLRIACMPASAQFIMPRLVADFVQDKPQVKVSLMMRASSVIEEWVASHQYDIGLAETPTPNNALKISTFELNCVCAIRHDDPLARQQIITPEDLSDKPMATLQEGHPTLVATRKAFSTAGASLNPRFELRNFQPALKLVEEKLCYCICDPMTASSYMDYQKGDPTLVFRSFIPRVALSVSILQSSQRPTSLLAEAFRNILAESLIQMNHEFG